MCFLYAIARLMIETVLRRDVVQDRDTLPAELSIRTTRHQVRLAVFSPECRYRVGCNLPRYSSGLSLLGLRSDLTS